MSRLAKRKNKATRVVNGGIHVYIPKDKLELALSMSGIPVDEKNLEIVVYPGKGTKGTAMLMLRLTQDKGEIETKAV